MKLSDRKNHREIFLALVITGLLVLFAVLFSRMTFLTPMDSLKGKPAPEIRFQHRGRLQNLSEKKGVVVMLYFWSVFCESCLNELPDLRQLENHFANEGLLLLAFDISQSDESVQREFRKQSYPRNLIFHFSKDNLLAYGLKSLPMAVLISKQGVVAEVVRGPQDWKDIQHISLIKRLLR